MKAIVSAAVVGLTAGLAIGALVLGPELQRRAEQAVTVSTEPVPQAVVEWSMASWFRGDTIQLGRLGRRLVETMRRVSGGTIALRFHEPGEIVPAKKCFETVAAGTVDACWSTPRYWYAKEPGLALFSGVPFGPTANEYAGWFYFGGGRELMDEIYAKHGIKSLICGVAAAEGSGWFRRQIQSVDDLYGLRMRFLGLGAKVMESMGVDIRLLATADILPALEQGSIDAAQHSMPAADLTLELYRAAPNYYFPGWHQQATFLELMMNLQQWDALTSTQKTQFETVCGDNFREGLAEGEAIQAKALTELRNRGVTFHRWSPDILADLAAAWQDIAAATAERDANFRRVWESYTAFRQEYRLWKELGYL